MKAALKHHIITEVENLIDYSCSLAESDNPNALRLQHAVLKKYFEAETVEFNVAASVISLEVKEDERSTKLIELNVDFSDLAGFLKTCLEKDRSSLRFYKNLLRYYHVIQPLSA